MKKLAACVALSAISLFAQGPAFAADPTASSCGISGVISSYSLLGSTYEEYEGDGYGMGISGKVNSCEVFGTSLNLQSDVYAEYAVADDGDFDGYNAVSIGSVNHLYWRDPDSYALGILFGLNHFGESYSDYGDGIDAVIGADAHIYFGNFTLAAQAAYWNNFKTEESSDAFADIDEAWDLSLEGRYFLTDNFKLTGRVSYDFNDSTFVDYYKRYSFRFGGGAEYQFESFPMSIFASYTRVEGDTDDYVMDSDIVKFGMSIHLNQDTLFAEDRNGASFSTPYVDPWTNISNAYLR